MWAILPGVLHLRAIHFPPLSHPVLHDLLELLDVFLVLVHHLHIVPFLVSQFLFQLINLELFLFGILGLKFQVKVVLGLDHLVITLTHFLQEKDQDLCVLSCPHVILRHHDHQSINELVQPLVAAQDQPQELFGRQIGGRERIRLTLLPIFPGQQGFEHLLNSPTTFHKIDLNILFRQCVPILRMEIQLIMLIILCLLVLVGVFSQCANPVIVVLYDGEGRHLIILIVFVLGRAVE